MLESHDIKAQTNSNTQIVLQNNVSDTNGVHQRLSKQQTIVKDTVHNIISGKVILEDTNEPVVLVNVGIPNTSVFTTTDSLGNFKLHVPENLLTDTISLQIMSPYYYTAEVKVAKTNLHNTVTLVAVVEKMIMGEMIAPPPPEKKKKGKGKK